MNYLYFLFSEGIPDTFKWNTRLLYLILFVEYIRFPNNLLHLIVRKLDEVFLKNIGVTVVISIISFFFHLEFLQALVLAISFMIS